jgi:LCP family protein required for cell wall assembly
MKKNETAGAPEGTPRKIWFARHKIATVVLAVVVVGLAAGGYFGVKMWNAFNDPASALIANTSAPTQEPATETPETTAGPADIAETPTPVPTPTPEPELHMDRNDVNILMLGVALDEYRQSIGRSDKQTDCIILVHIQNLKANEKPEVTMMSIPRDVLLVNLYDDKGNKITGNQAVGRINTAYALGGIEGAKKTISHYLGDIPIDKYVLFDMEFVKNFIDAVDGVDVEVKDLKADTVTTVNGVTLYNNTVMHMDGNTALTYARDRHNTKMGDYVRGDHMQDVMKALLDKLKDKGNLISHAWELYQTFSKQLTTDIDNYQEIAALAGIAMRMDMGGIRSPKIIRYEDLHHYESMSVFYSDPATKKAVLKDVFGIDYTMPTEETYSAIMAPINKVANSTKKTIDGAKAWLTANAGHYGDPTALNNAIKAWEDAKFNADSKSMQSSAKKVTAELDKLKGTLTP